MPSLTLHHSPLGRPSIQERGHCVLELSPSLAPSTLLLQADIVVLLQLDFQILPHTFHRIGFDQQMSVVEILDDESTSWSGFGFVELEEDLFHRRVAVGLRVLVSWL